MADAYTVRPTGRAAERLAATVEHLISEGRAGSRNAAVLAVLIAGLDAMDAQQAERAAGDRPGRS